MELLGEAPLRSTSSRSWPLALFVNGLKRQGAATQSDRNVLRLGVHFRVTLPRMDQPPLSALSLAQLPGTSGMVLAKRM